MDKRVLLIGVIILGGFLFGYLYNSFLQEFIATRFSESVSKVVYILILSGICFIAAKVSNRNDE